MILLSGQIESISTRKDKTIRLTIGSQELSPKQCTEVFQLNQSFCYIGLKPEPFTKDEAEIIDSLKTDLDTIKTPSQRLRAILFRAFEQDSENYLSFSTYYSSKMEQICQHYKSKLD